jgi:hypothetical protein
MNDPCRAEVIAPGSGGWLRGSAADMDRCEHLILSQNDIAKLGQFQAGAEGGGSG